MTQLRVKVSIISAFVVSECGERGSHARGKEQGSRDLRAAAAARRGAAVYVGTVQNKRFSRSFYFRSLALRLLSYLRTYLRADTHRSDNGHLIRRRVENNAKDANKGRA